MILSTTEFIPEREIEKILGIARGSTVRSRNVARDLVAQLKNIIGGEIEEYTKLQAYAREQALGLLKDGPNDSKSTLCEKLELQHTNIRVK